MLENQKVKPSEIGLLTWGAWFRDVSEKMFIEFLETYHRIEDGKYAPVLAGIIHQYVEIHSDFIDDAKDILLEYLSAPGIFEDPNTMTLYHWDALSTDFMDRFNDTVPYFLDLILDILSRENYADIEPYPRKKLRDFLEKDLENTWNKIKDALLGNDLLAWNLTEILRGDYGSFRRGKNSPLGLIPEAYILRWVGENPDEAPYVLARMVPLHESEPILHPLAKRLLVEYPDNEDIASALSANWHTEGWVGPMSAHFQEKLEIAERWTRDPEPSVVKWAGLEVKRLKEEYKELKRREEEGFPHSWN